MKKHEDQDTYSDFTLTNYSRWYKYLKECNGAQAVHNLQFALDDFKKDSKTYIKNLLKFFILCNF